MPLIYRIQFSSVFGTADFKEIFVAAPAVCQTQLLFINGVATDTIDLYPFFNIFRKFDTGFELQVTFNFGVHVSSLDVGNQRRNLVLLHLYSTVTVCGGNLCYHEIEWDGRVRTCFINK
jgi:hypothetical protein